MKTAVLVTAIVLALMSCAETNNQEAQNSPTMVIVDATSTYVLQGDTFHAQVVPVNSDQWNNLITFENTGAKVTESRWENGVMKVSIIADAPGLSTFSGNFKFKTANGDTTIPFSSEYVVVKPTVAVKTNALIKDFENPIELGIVGVPPLFELSAEDADINGELGKYTINPHKSGSLTLKVKSKDGKVDYGSYEFEVFERK